MPESVPPSTSQARATELQSLGRYRLQDVLGRGAMGVVYRAYDPIIDRPVAIKTIRLDVSVDQDEKLAFYERFFREAQTAGKLSHPNIVTIFDIGEDKGITFLAMELIEGTSLQHYVDHPGSLTLPQILEIVREVALGLDYAHQKQIVHRDVKPANIMLLSDDRVKVTDFGIAKVTTASALTHSGVFLGSPNYMSPEQVNGKNLDGRSDLFSLGTVLYELVTGKKPFQGDHVAATIYNVANLKPPRPRDLVPDLPVSINRLLIKAMQKTPEARYQNAKAFADEVDELLAEMGVRRATPVRLGNVGGLDGKAREEDRKARRTGRILTPRRLMDAAAGAAIALVLVAILHLLTRGGGAPESSGLAPAPTPTPTSLVATLESPGLRRKEERILGEPTATRDAEDGSDERIVPPPARSPVARPSRTPPPTAAATRPAPGRTPGADAAARTPPAPPASPAPAASPTATPPSSEAAAVATPPPAETAAPATPDADATPAAPVEAAFDPRSQEARTTNLLNQYVETLQNDASYKLRLQAAENLGHLRDDRAVPYLQYSAANDDSTQVRTRCRKILEDTFGVEGT